MTGIVPELDRVLARATQRCEQTDGRSWGGLWQWGRAVKEAGFLNGKMLLDLEQGTKVGREATCRFKGKPNGEKSPLPKMPNPKPKNTKTNSKESSKSSSTASWR